MILWFYHLKDGVQLIGGVKAKCIALVLLSMTSRDLECFQEGNTIKTEFWVGGVCCCLFFWFFLNNEPTCHTNKLLFCIGQPQQSRGHFPRLGLFRTESFHTKIRPRVPFLGGAAARGAGPVPPRRRRGGAAAAPGGASGSPTGGQQDRAFGSSTGSRLPRGEEAPFCSPVFGKSEPGPFLRFCWVYITFVCRSVVPCVGIAVLASDGLKGCGQFRWI